jgi:hypothetical protein
MNGSTKLDLGERLVKFSVIGSDLTETITNNVSRKRLSTYSKTIN